MGSLEDNKNGLFTVDLTHNNKQESRWPSEGSRWALGVGLLLPVHAFFAEALSAYKTEASCCILHT